MEQQLIVVSPSMVNIYCNQQQIKFSKNKNIPNDFRLALYLKCYLYTVHIVPLSSLKRRLYEYRFKIKTSINGILYSSACKEKSNMFFQGMFYAIIFFEETPKKLVK